MDLWWNCCFNSHNFSHWEAIFFESLLVCYWLLQYSARDLENKTNVQTGVDFSGTILCSFLWCPLINHLLLKWQRWCKGWNTTYWMTWKCCEHSFEKKTLKVCPYLVCLLGDLWLVWKDEARSGGRCSWYALWCGIWILVNREFCFICMWHIQDLE